jgi:hypothetical protein
MGVGAERANQLDTLRVADRGDVGTEVLAICTVAVPIEPDAPYTSTLCPARRPD